MIFFVRRLVKTLERFGFFKIYRVLYEGVGVSNNDFYAGAQGRNGWKVRAGIKAKYSKIFGFLLKTSKIPKLNEFGVLVFYNSKHDVDNVSASAKLLIDSMKGVVCKDDNSKYFKGMFIVHDPNLKKNTFEFLILKIK